MTTPMVYNIHGSAVINIADQWYLNEENIFVCEEDSALDILEEKITNVELKKQALVEESYGVEQAIKLVKKYNNKVTHGLLESCLSLALSKSITNRPDVLELRMQGANVADKYIFQIGEELVALSVSDIDTIRATPTEVLESCKTADDLYELLKETY